MRINPVFLGIVVGILVSLSHAVWVVFVAAGIAQPILDFLFWIHFVRPPYQIEAFEFYRAGILVGTSFAVGLVLGIMFGILWNSVHRARR